MTQKKSVQGNCTTAQGNARRPQGKWQSGDFKPQPAEPQNGERTESEPKGEELRRLFPPKAAALQMALIEWYKFNDCLQHLSGVMDDRDKDDCYTAGYYKRFFDESINAIHDKIASELSRTLEDHALDTAF